MGGRELTDKDFRELEAIAASSVASGDYFPVYDASVDQVKKVPADAIAGLAEDATALGALADDATALGLLAASQTAILAVSGNSTFLAALTSATVIAALTSPLVTESDATTLTTAIALANANKTAINTAVSKVNDIIAKLKTSGALASA